MVVQNSSLRSQESFAEYLVRQKALSSEQAEIVYQEQLRYQSKQLNLQEEKGSYSITKDQTLEYLSFERLALSLGFLQENQFIHLLSRYSQYPIVDLNHYPYDHNLLDQTFVPFLRQYRVFPLKKDTKIFSKKSIAILELAVVDPYNIKALDAVRLLYQVDQITLVLCTEQQLAYVFDTLLLKNTKFVDLLKKIPLDITSLEDTVENPVEENIYFILTQAFHKKATDIHFQPHNQWVYLNYRIKGLLQPIAVFHKKYWSFINTRLKIMAALDIANQRLPQSGQFIFCKGHQKIACRLSTHPLTVSSGDQEEALVLRFLNSDNGFFALEELNFTPYYQEKLKTIAENAQGLTIIVGPTGSGKTTTAYALLKTLKHHCRKIMTLEEPIEFFFSFLYQTEIRSKDELTFEEALRSILRQDPDILFIGEIRDSKAAQLAVQTAMVGHSVFTTIHAYDALSVIPRLINLGVDSQIFAHRIHKIIAQRLIRNLCSFCKKPVEIEKIDPFYTSILSFLKTAQGCAHCNFTGYTGRIPLIEILETNQEFHQLMDNSYDASACKRWAESIEFVPLSQMALEHLLAGDMCLMDVLAEIDLKQWMSEHPLRVQTLIAKYSHDRFC